jgi:glyoxylase-like metal-dependent hydrolase (beta-lactamase superfamily II)
MNWILSGKTNPGTMETTLELIILGRGNAWPVPLGEEHPFYDRTDPVDLSNAAFSLQIREAEGRMASVLVDAGHGTVQSLLAGDNRIPDSICLTHGHLDHTLSVDWVVQSYWRGPRKEKRYPIYATLPVYRFLLQAYPQLEGPTEHRELEFGVAIPPGGEMPFRLTPFPVYHGQSAVGAAMLLFGYGNRKVLFTGDMLVPLLRKEDYEQLRGVDLLVVDSNNRFPWPRTNHWSFAGSPGDPLKRSKELEILANGLSLEQALRPHLHEGISDNNLSYLSGLEREWVATEAPLTILEFLERIRPRRVVLVHYSGTEDRKHHGQEILDPAGLQAWVSETARTAGFPGEIVVPENRQRIQIELHG